MVHYLTSWNRKLNQTFSVRLYIFYCPTEYSESFHFCMSNNFASCFVWVWNMVADTEGGKQAEGVWEYGVEENIWT